MPPTARVDPVIIVDCPFCFGPIVVRLRGLPSPKPGDEAVVIVSAEPEPHICHTAEAA